MTDNICYMCEQEFPENFDWHKLSYPTPTDIAELQFCGWDCLLSFTEGIMEEPDE